MHPSCRTIAGLLLTLSAAMASAQTPLSQAAKDEITRTCNAVADMKARFQCIREQVGVHYKAANPGFGTAPPASTAAPAVSSAPAGPALPRADAGSPPPSGSAQSPEVRLDATSGLSDLAVLTQTSGPPQSILDRLPRSWCSPAGAAIRCIRPQPCLREQIALERAHWPRDVYVAESRLKRCKSSSEDSQQIGVRYAGVPLSSARISFAGSQVAQIEMSAGVEEADALDVHFTQHFGSPLVQELTHRVSVPIFETHAVPDPATGQLVNPGGRWDDQTVTRRSKRITWYGKSMQVQMTGRSFLVLLGQ